MTQISVFRPRLLPQRSNKSKQSVLALIVALHLMLVGLDSLAQAPSSQTTGMSQKNEKIISPFKWGVEANVLFPIYPGGVISAKATRTLWSKGSLRGDLLIGFKTELPRTRDTEGRFSDLALASGYRQYFWKGLNVEFYQNFGWARLRNSVLDGRDYNSFDWLMAGLIGYRADLGKRLYILPQVGFAKVVYKSNPWPIFEEADLAKEVGEEPFLYGGVQLGIRF